jgi:sporulation protein YlmC with PRC-barrel domain
VNYPIDEGSKNASVTDPEIETDAERQTANEGHLDAESGTETRTDTETETTAEESVTLTQADEGKNVVDADGRTVGMISTVQGDMIHIDPDPNTSMAERITSELGWGRNEEDEITIQPEQIEEVQDDAIVLSRVEQDELNEE